jgi:predicted dehydrogenase
MGPYFLTTLVSILGPVESLFCYANRGWDVRKIWGKDVEVETLTNYCGVLQFKEGAVGSINMSFDEWKTNQPAMEIYGTEGVIIAPDPNTMNGPIKLLRANAFTELVESKSEMLEKIGAIYGPESYELFEEIETVAPRIGNQRGAGVADMANAILNGRKPRVSAELCRHVTEAINAFDVSATTRAPYVMTTTCEKPEIMNF